MTNQDDTAFEKLLEAVCDVWLWEQPQDSEAIVEIRQYIAALRARVDSETARATLAERQLAEARSFGIQFDNSPIVTVGELLDSKQSPHGWNGYVNVNFHEVEQGTPEYDEIKRRLEPANDATASTGVDGSGTDDLRLSLELQLSSPSATIRSDAVATLINLDDPVSIPAIEAALEQETISDLRGEMEQALDYLRSLA